ncbi:hypothetical protein V6N13_076445 [Hibiscus sabdariffa]|uniref:YDG domain-containing protein n=1 Tax=Hibiscus sabdariffa TaxID=183260 RepID=A0ABR2ABL3_9ROSI
MVGPLGRFFKMLGVAPRKKPSIFTREWRERRVEIQTLLQSYRKFREDLRRTSRNNSGSKLSRTHLHSKILNSISADPELKKLVKPVSVGLVLGVMLGDSFYWRGELIAAGLHNHLEKSISVRESSGKIYATTIVDSGRYEDNLDNILNSPSFVYTGERSKGINGALINNLIKEVPVKVIAKVKEVNPVNELGYKFCYQGLYKVARQWVESPEATRMVYKFQMVRMEDRDQYDPKWLN